MKPWPVFRGSSHLRRGLSAGSHAPRCPWFTHSLAPPPAPVLSPALCPDAALTTKPPSVQSPFARCWRYLHRGGVPRLLGRHCSSVLAHTDSCADPDWLSPTSVFTSFEESLQVATSPCCHQDLPDVISASPSRDAWTPTTTACRLHLPVASPATSAFPKRAMGRRAVRFH